jgi:hypothetical protein
MWWQWLIGAAVLILPVYAFRTVAGFQTLVLRRKTDRSLDSIYGRYRDSDRRQQKYARQHGGQWRDREE